MVAENSYRDQAWYKLQQHRSHVQQPHQLPLHHQGSHHNNKTPHNFNHEVKYRLSKAWFHIFSSNPSPLNITYADGKSVCVHVCTYACKLDSPFLFQCFLSLFLSYFLLNQLPLLFLTVNTFLPYSSPEPCGCCPYFSSPLLLTMWLQKFFHQLFPNHTTASHWLAYCFSAY